jgi:mono/diheme cytochrome c family protein
MTPIWRWSLVGLGCAAGLGALAVACSFIVSRSDAVLNARHPAAPSAVHVVSSPEAVARGEHLVLVGDCAACHGKTLSGGMMTLSSSTLYASNLTVVSKTVSDAALDRAIRGGLRPDGTSELAMPSQAYASLTDDEVAAVIAYLRSLPTKGIEAKQPPLGLVLRTNLVLGALKTEVVRVAEVRPPLEAAPRFDRGRRLAAFACGQCHGTDLAGAAGSPGSDLTVRGYYDRGQFRKLMRTGDGLGEHMELMSETAVASFSHFTDDEIDAIFDYLIARDRLLSARPKP